MNDDFKSPETGRTDDSGGDARLEAALRHLDPGRADAGYWHRFHATVMASASDELARRRMLADVTVSELVTSWGRALVPAAMVAAAAASFLVFQPADRTASPSQNVPVALEEMLDGPGFTNGFFASDAEGGGMSVAFATEGF